MTFAARDDPSSLLKLGKPSAAHPFRFGEDHRPVNMWIQPVAAARRGFHEFQRETGSSYE